MCKLFSDIFVILTLKTSKLSTFSTYLMLITLFNRMFHVKQNVCLLLVVLFTNLKFAIFLKKK